MTTWCGNGKILLRIREIKHEVLKMEDKNE